MGASVDQVVLAAAFYCAVSSSSWLALSLLALAFL